MESLLDKVSVFLEKNGFATLVAIVVFATFMGWVPSPMLHAQTNILEKMQKASIALEKQTKILNDQYDESRESARRMLSIMRAQCINGEMAKAKRDDNGIRICLESNEYRQRQMIEHVIAEKRR